MAAAWSVRRSIWMSKSAKVRAASSNPASPRRWPNFRRLKPPRCPRTRSLERLLAAAEVGAAGGGVGRRRTAVDADGGRQQRSEQQYAAIDRNQVAGLGRPDARGLSGGKRC